MKIYYYYSVPTTFFFFFVTKPWNRPILRNSQKVHWNPFNQTSLTKMHWKTIWLENGLANNNIPLSTTQLNDNSSFHGRVWSITCLIQIWIKTRKWFFFWKCRTFCESRYDIIDLINNHRLRRVVLWAGVD